MNPAFEPMISKFIEYSKLVKPYELSIHRELYEPGCPIRLRLKSNYNIVGRFVNRFELMNGSFDCIEKHLKSMKKLMDELEEEV
jgi:hypothetical protein